MITVNVHRCDQACAIDTESLAVQESGQEEQRVPNWRCDAEHDGRRW